MTPKLTRLHYSVQIIHKNILMMVYLTYKIMLLKQSAMQTWLRFEAKLKEKQR